ncbi:hypothetical protein DH2020_016930 [Rehmannia glutinosa]|uniref:Transposase, Ptta/En/Spm, plant n=1 Tax=Rehmannia glutinosa TaxID=99300 RepID=A0ABR0WQD0_REHGL
MALTRRWLIRSGGRRRSWIDQDAMSLDAPTPGFVHDDPAFQAGPSTSTSSAPTPSAPTPCGSSQSLPNAYVLGPKLMPPTTSGDITKIFKHSIYVNGYNWKSVPDDKKEHYFEEFKASKLYSDMISKFKTQKEKKGQPRSVPDDAWKTWLVYWSQPEVVAISKKASNNRMSETGPPGSGCSRHCGGSRSYIGHAIAFEKETGRTPTTYDTFLRTHMKQNGTFVDGRSKQVSEDVETRLAVTPEAREEPTEMDGIFLDVVGIKKQRVYGTGSQAYLFTNIGGSNAPPFDEEAMRRQVTQQVTSRSHNSDRKRVKAADDRWCRAARPKAGRRGGIERLENERHERIQLQSQESELVRMMMESRRHGQMPPP